MERNRLLFVTSLSAICIWSASQPHDLLTWFLEAFPVLIGVPLIAYLWPRAPFTPVTYIFIWLHCIVLLVGAHYTYELVPLGEWFQSAFDLQRNHYDRLGHFMQGFVPALIAREVLLHVLKLPRGFWLALIVTSICLAFSAFYELLEWWSAMALGESADAFLGTQGDNWDTQWDMFLALCGAISSQILLSGTQDKQLNC